MATLPGFGFDLAKHVETRECREPSKALYGRANNTLLAECANAWQRVDQPCLSGNGLLRLLERDALLNCAE